MKRRVLFLCTGNSCRSQMAEGWLRHLGGDRYQALSAGTRPQGVHPLAIRVMAEAGVDLSGHRSKAVGELQDQHLDLLVTVCGGARESCPLFPGEVKERRHWPFDDPAEAQGAEDEVLAVFRRVRDEIRARIESFLKEG
ncbi:MAG: arsenate reductase ArsC [Deferrisomatales bacterium]